MPKCLAFLGRLPAFLLCTGISLAFGFVVPSIYELTQERVSHGRHVKLELLALAVVLFTIVVCAVITGLRHKPAKEQGVACIRPNRQFSLRQIFLAVSLFAVVFAIAPLLDAPLASVLTGGVAIAIAGWSIVIGSWEIRSRVGCLLVNSFIPFVWMIAYNRPFGHTSGLAVNIPIGPGILIAELLRGVTGFGADDTAKLAGVVVIVQLLIGAWLTRRGGMLSTVYLLLLFAFSSLSSLFLHAMYRA